jgi:hypothetical protein
MRLGARKPLHRLLRSNVAVTQKYMRAFIAYPKKQKSKSVSERYTATGGGLITKCLKRI